MKLATGGLLDRDTIIALGQDDIKEIVSDPAIAAILTNSAKKIPEVVAALNNPETREKIDVLVAAGLMDKTLIEALSAADVQDMVRDPLIAQLLGNSADNDEIDLAIVALSNPETKDKIDHLINAGILSKKLFSTLSNPDTQRILQDEKIKLLMNSSNDDFDVAIKALMDDDTSMKVDHLVSVGLLNRRQFTTLSMPEVQEALRDPTIRYLVKDLTADLDLVLRSLLNPTIRSHINVLAAVGLIDRKLITALETPEIIGIIADPIIAMLVSDRSNEHLDLAVRCINDPIIATKIDKLVNVGLLDRKLYVALRKTEVLEALSDPLVKRLARDLTADLDMACEAVNLPHVRAHIHTLVSAGLLDRTLVATLAKPEIQGILADPVIKQLTKDLTQDLALTQRSLADPDKRSKVHIT